MISNLQPTTYPLRANQGFTLIEFLIVIAITLILAVAAVPIYGNLQVSGQLNDTQDRFVQAVKTARQRSIAGLNNSAHGIYLEINANSPDRYILYQGPSYAGRNAEFDKVQSLFNTISATSTISLNEINFSKGLGVPNATGTVTFTHDSIGSRVLQVNRLGIIEAL
jgi:prepilin-type N-terminal cleavage/methylation domain-containing protein